MNADTHTSIHTIHSMATKSLTVNRIVKLRMPISLCNKHLNVLALSRSPYLYLSLSAYLCARTHRQLNTKDNANANTHTHAHIRLVISMQIRIYGTVCMCLCVRMNEYTYISTFTFNEICIEASICI